jgi:hypothetical protein
MTQIRRCGEKSPHENPSVMLTGGHGDSDRGPPRCSCQLGRCICTRRPKTCTQHCIFALLSRFLSIFLSPPSECAGFHGKFIRHQLLLLDLGKNRSPADLGCQNPETPNELNLRDLILFRRLYLSRRNTFRLHHWASLSL